MIRALQGSAFVSLALFAVACGGSTRDDDIFDGTAAEAGTSAEGGAPDAGGTSGAGTGGASGGAGGAALGGGGSGGSSGSGGAPGPTPGELAPQCESMCRAAAEAACPNEEPEQDCVRSCRLAVNQPACGAAFQALFTCTANAAFGCDDEGQASVPECELQAAVAGLCFLGNAPDPTLREPCQRYCTSASAAGCANAAPVGDCLYGCQSAGTLAPECSASWSEFLTCSESAAFYCGDEGDPVAGGCESGFLRYAACIIDASE